MSVNKVILIGNLGKDPEVRYLDSGVAVANFSLATNESYKDKNGETVTKTEWHNIVFWSKLAEIAEKYLKKGQQIYVEGKIRTRSWDGDNGNKRYTTEILGNTMKMLGRKSDSDPGEAKATSQENNYKEEFENEPQDDLPF